MRAHAADVVKTPARDGLQTEVSPVDETGEVRQELTGHVLQPPSAA